VVQKQKLHPRRDLLLTAISAYDIILNLFDKETHG